MACRAFDDLRQRQVVPRQQLVVELEFALREIESLLNEVDVTGLHGTARKCLDVKVWSLRKSIPQRIENKHAANSTSEPGTAQVARGIPEVWSTHISGKGRGRPKGPWPFSIAQSYSGAEGSKGVKCA
jgi:hypothetical protein